MRWTLATSVPRAWSAVDTGYQRTLGPECGGHWLPAYPGPGVRWALATSVPRARGAVGTGYQRTSGEYEYSN